MNTMPATRVEGETAIDSAGELSLLEEFSVLDPLDALPWAERRAIKRTQCERGEVPTRHLPTPEMGWHSMYHFCNDALCKRCGPYLANQAKVGTVAHLSRVGKKKIRRVVFEVDGDYGYLRDRINRLLTKYGIKRRIYPHESEIVVHLDGHVPFMSFNTLSDKWLKVDEIDWLKEIRGARSRKQSGNLFPKKPKLVADVNVEVLVERIAVKRGTDRKLLGKARAESMKAIQDISLPSAESMMNLDPITYMNVQEKIQDAYDVMTKRFIEVIQEEGVEIVGNTRVRVGYILKESVSKIYVDDLTMREMNQIERLIPI